MDKNKAVIDYLLQCPKIANSKLFFNFGQEIDEGKQIITQGNDKALNRGYIDGSVLKQFTFTLYDYRSITDQALFKSMVANNENVEEIMDVQGLIDWIGEQNDLRNFPNFGANCEIDEIKASTENPILNGINASVSPAIAKYSVVITITYLDNTKRIY